MAKKKSVIEKGNTIIVSKVCAKQGICTKCRTRGSAVCLTCAEYQQIIKYDEKFMEMMEFLDKVMEENEVLGKRCKVRGKR